jgi:nickel/cobalt transporter (NicO) family protein
VSAGGDLQRVGRGSLLVGLAAAALIGAIVPAAAQFGSLGGMHPAPATGFFGWLLGQQAFFYRALAGLIRTAKSNGSAYWALMGVSFVYGIFHAAGPGHGKAVISSYVLANEETWRRGITLSFAAAVLQSITAITIVAIAALLIGGTAKMMGDTVRAIETTSYVMIIAIGARLLWVKARSFRSTLHKLRSEADPVQVRALAGSDTRVAARENTDADCHGHAHSRSHHHACGHPAHADHAHGADHGHSHDEEEEDSVLPWGHAHGPEPVELAGPGGWRRGLSTIVAVGLRPCSGAIIVLVFALAQGLFWAGIASTFVMGLGTAMTVSAIASLAVGAKSLAKRLSARPTGYGALLLRGFEVGAACLVILVGVALLTGYMASERMGFF